MNNSSKKILFFFDKIEEIIKNSNFLLYLKQNYTQVGLVTVNNTSRVLSPFVIFSDIYNIGAKQQQLNTDDNKSEITKIHQLKEIAEHINFQKWDRAISLTKDTYLSSFFSYYCEKYNLEKEGIFTNEKMSIEASSIFYGLTSFCRNESMPLYISDDELLSYQLGYSIKQEENKKTEDKTTSLVYLNSNYLHSSYKQVDNFITTSNAGQKKIIAINFSNLFFERDIQNILILEEFVQNIVEEDYFAPLFILTNLDTKCIEFAKMICSKFQDNCQLCIVDNKYLASIIQLSNYTLCDSEYFHTISAKYCHVSSTILTRSINIAQLNTISSKQYLINLNAAQDSTSIADDINLHFYKLEHLTSSRTKSNNFMEYFSSNILSQGYYLFQKELQLLTIDKLMTKNQFPNNVIKNEQSHIKNYLSLILATIKDVKNFNNKSSKKRFVSNLNLLLKNQDCASTQITSIIISNNLNALGNMTPKESIKHVENELFKAKKTLQKIIYNLNSIVTNHYERRN